MYDEDAENKNSANESHYYSANETEIAAAGPNDPPLPLRVVVGKLFSIKMLLDHLVLISGCNNLVDSFHLLSDLIFYTDK